MSMEMKTAEQINLPQTGKVEIAESMEHSTANVPHSISKPVTRTPVAIPGGLISSKPKMQSQKNQPSDAVAGDIAGWSLRAVRGTREEVREMVWGAQSLPEDAKVFLVAMIDALPAKVHLVSLDAHSQQVTLHDGRVKKHGFWDVSEL